MIWTPARGALKRGARLLVKYSEHRHFYKAITTMPTLTVSDNICVKLAWKISDTFADVAGATQAWPEGMASLMSNYTATNPQRHFN